MTMKLPDDCVIANQPSQTIENEPKDQMCLLLMRSPKLFAAVKDMYGN